MDEYLLMFSMAGVVVLLLEFAFIVALLLRIKLRQEEEEMHLYSMWMILKRTCEYVRSSVGQLVTTSKK